MSNLQVIWTQDQIFTKANYSNPYIVMESDGNLASRDGNGDLKWDSATHNSPGGYLILQDDAVLAVVDKTGLVLMKSPLYSLCN
jgi:hypothetical protein